MKEGDFVRIDYVGRIKGSGEIFDLTKEDVARKNGIYNPNMNYKPVPIIIGARMVIKGLEDALKRAKAYIQAGAGIVAYSSPEKEYQETLNKAGALFKAIELAEEGIE